MRKSAFVKCLLGLLCAAGVATAQPFTSWQYFDPADTSKVPKLLSKTGFFTNLAVNKTIISSANYFDVNAPLWSDGSHKKRWFILKPGKSIGFTEKGDYWTYPDSTVFVKQFAIDTVPGDTLTRLIWETRLLILKREVMDPSVPVAEQKKVDTWYGFSYKWRRDQKEADLMVDSGDFSANQATLRIFPNGLSQPAVLKKWIFPTRNDCNQCHVTQFNDVVHGRSVLGFFTAQLNRPALSNPSVNQLDDWFTRNLLTGAKPAAWTNSPKWFGLDSTDPKATLAVRARSYIAANCSGCHGDRGKDLGAIQNPALNYDYYDMDTNRIKYAYFTPSFDYGLSEAAPAGPQEDPKTGVYLITPKYPQKSVLLYRQLLRNTVAPTATNASTAFSRASYQMPPLATFEVNTAAMAVLNAWALSMPDTGAYPISTRPGRIHQSLASPTVTGRQLLLPTAMVQGNPKVGVIGLDGRPLKLTRLNDRTYALPSALPAGIYIIRVGTQSFSRHIF
jgi:hypothetical protein